MFGDTLKYLLEKNHISQKQLASELNIGASTLGNYIQNTRQPDFEIVVRIADYFHVSIDYLFDHSSNSSYTKDEERLIEIYRRIPAERKVLFIEISEAFAKR